MKVMEQRSISDYARIFEEECAQSYPAVDAFERALGYAIDRTKLESAARVLACPLKDNPPNWQHGRVLYSVARHYFSGHMSAEPFQMLDIGTAKGFSALCVEWARRDAMVTGSVYSVDVLDPNARVRRNTVDELDGFKTLHETLAPWSEAKAIEFKQSTGIDWLKQCSPSFRIHVAFIDGKHSGAVVAEEARLLAARQASGDLVVFDDAQIPAVKVAIDSAQAVYALQTLTAKAGREYVIGRRR